MIEEIVLKTCKDNPYEKYINISKIGQGSYGSVHKVSDDAGNFYAMKILQIEEDYSREDMLKEVSILSLCDNPFLVKFFEFLEWETKLFLVMELCDTGSVLDLIQMCSLKFDEETIKEIVASTVLGLRSLHKNLIIHRDLKAGNLFVSKFGQVKLGDFGVSAKLKSEQEKRTSVIGTPFWMAPEIIMENPYDTKADIWSLGITLIEIAEQKPPLSHMYPLRALRNIVTRPAPKFNTPKKWSDAMNNFLARCLQKKVELRPDCGTLSEHDFISNEVKLLQGRNSNLMSKMRRLVQENAEKLQNTREKENEKHSTVSHSMSLGDTPLYVPSMKKIESSLFEEDVEGEYSDRESENFRSLLVVKSFFRHTTAPISDSVFFHQETVEEVGKEIEETHSSIIAEMRDEISVMNEKYGMEVEELRSSYQKRRRRLIKNIQR